MAGRMEDLIDLRTGASLKARDILALPDSQTFPIRKELEVAYVTKQNYLVCAICGAPVKLRAGGESRYCLHFAHVKDTTECPIKTMSRLTKSQILAMKFNGAKESLRHIRMKNQIAEILRIDRRFTNVSVEAVVKSLGERREWRKPDVSALFDNKPVVFEVQLSTTFLSVIVERSIFYKRNATPLIWIFDHFDPSDTRFTDRDIFYNNNSNAIVFDADCYRQSIESNQLKLKVFYCKPMRSIDGKICKNWGVSTVDVGELTFGSESVFYYDTDGVTRSLAYENDNVNFLTFMREHKNVHIEPEQFRYRVCTFDRHGLERIVNRHDLVAVSSFLAILLSIKEQSMYGFKYQNELQLVNHVYDHLNSYFHLLVGYLRESGLERRILERDKKGTYASRVEKFIDEDSERDNSFKDVFCRFFPEITDCDF